MALDIRSEPRGSWASSLPMPDQNTCSRIRHLGLRVHSPASNGSTLQTYQRA